MKRVAAILLAACGSKSEPPPPVLDLSCVVVVAHVADLTLNPTTGYIEPLIKPKAPIAETDPRAFREKRINASISGACKGKQLEEYLECSRAAVLSVMARECHDRDWSDERKRCLLAAKDGAALDACGPAPAPILDAPADAQTKPIGGDCFRDDECGPAAKCVAWTTEGGERHATCEIPCGPKPDYACPAGRGCVHQGGGPSEVCLERK